MHFPAEAASAGVDAPLVVTNLRTHGMVIPGRNCIFECGVDPNAHNIITWTFNGKPVDAEKLKVRGGKKDSMNIVLSLFFNIMLFIICS